MGIEHLYKCRRAPTSADCLYVACMKDEMFRDDGEVEDHFRFNRFLRGYQKTNLLGLYQGVFKYHEASPREVHRWRIEGTLVENIIQLFESWPEPSRGCYYPWWKDNLHIFNRTPEVVDSCHGAELLEYPMSQLDPADRDKEIKDLEPEAKREAFSFFAMIVNHWVPPPETSVWYSFGFCTCRNAILPEGQFIQYHSESALAGLYRSLLGTVPDKSMERHFGHIYCQIMDKPRCSFTEFWKAYDRESLPSLFRKYGLEREMKQVTPHFAEFISSRFVHPSVWRLINHLAALTEVEQDQEISPPIMADYGFMFCRSTRQKNALLKAYKKVLLVADPLDLHQACICGQLWNFCSRVVPDLDKGLQSVMSNIYPLHSGNPAETGSALDKRSSPARRRNAKSHRPSTTLVNTSLSPVPSTANVPLDQAAKRGYGGRHTQEDRYKVRREVVEDAQPQGLIASVINYLFSWILFWSET
jgi:hypothetical protein